MKKRIMVFLIVLVITIGIVGVILTQNSGDNTVDEENIIPKEKQEKIEVLYEYGNMIEKMDLLPNTIIARFNGQEILFHEVKSYRNSINYSIENSENVEEFIEKNAFYEVILNKLYSYLAKTYPSAVTYGMDIAARMEKTKKEWYEGTDSEDVKTHQKKWLETLFIKEDEIWLSEEDFVTYLQYRSVEMDLQSKGMRILYNFMTEKPELANDKELEKMVEEHLMLKDKTKKLMEENKTEEALSINSDSMDIYTKIKDLYICDLILNAEIELCVDKKELYTEVPEIYKGK